MQRTANPSEVQSAFRRKAREAHPDKGGTNGGFNSLKEASDVLKDPARKAEYDKELTQSLIRKRQREAISSEVPSTPPRTRKTPGLDATPPCPTRKASSESSVTGLGTCFLCGCLGHYVSDCPSAKQNGIPASDTCLVCLEAGHWAKDCPVKKQSMTCFRCGQARHWAQNCTQRSRPY